MAGRCLSVMPRLRDVFGQIVPLWCMAGMVETWISNRNDRAHRHKRLQSAVYPFRHPGVIGLQKRYLTQERNDEQILDSSLSGGSRI